MSEDGRFRLCIPPGALATPTPIVVSGLDPYSVERSDSTDPLVFAMPVTIKFQDDMINLCRGLYIVDLTQGTPTTLSNQMTIMEANGERIVSAETSLISPESVFQRTVAFDLSIGGMDPLPIEQGMTVTVPVEFHNSTGGPLTAEWRVDSTDYSVEHSTAPPFPSAMSMMFIPLAATDSFEVTCAAGNPPSGTVTVTIRTTSPMSTNNISPITAVCKRNVTCTSSGMPGGVIVGPQPVYIDLPDLESPENIDVVPFPTSGPPENVKIDVAGAPVGTTGMVFQRVDGVTGQVLIDIQYPDAPGTPFPTAAFDAFRLEPSANGASAGALSLSGVNRFVVTLDPNGDPEPVGQFSFGSYPHSTLIGNDPTLGAVYIRPFGLDLVRPDPQLGTFVIEDNAVSLQQDLRSVVANPAADEFVGLRSNGGLVWIQAPPGGPVTETMILSTAANHGRLRWDPAGGIGAFSDFVQSTVTAFSWTGNGPPVILDTANVGSGPVGLGVRGHRIAAAGFNDDTLTRMELDPSTGLFTTVEIVPNPFAADGATQPGHIRFITPQAVAISYNGSGGIGVIPDFYPSLP